MGYSELLPLTPHPENVNVCGTIVFLSQLKQESAKIYSRWLEAIRRERFQTLSS